MRLPLLALLFAASTTPCQSLKPPIVFEANTGRYPETVAYVARLGPEALFLARGEFVFVRGGAVVRAQFLGARSGGGIAGEGRRQGVVRHLRGSDPSGWFEAPVFGAVRYVECWPGVDLRFHGDRGELEYDFLVSPGADPSVIALRFSGGALTLETGGDLVVATDSGAVRHRAPVAWQGEGKDRQEVAAEFVIEGDTVRLSLGDYDRSRPLVVDPVIVYTTYLGGSSGEQDSSIDVDGNQAVVVGVTSSTDFPLAMPLQSNRGGNDYFVTKFTTDGSGLVFSTYLGGNLAETGQPDVIVMGDGRVCVAGGTFSNDYPTTPGSFMPNKPGANVAAVLTILDATGAMSYSTYYGGTSATRARAVATFAGSVFIGGDTGAANLPGTGNGYQPGPGGGTDGFVAAFIATVPGSVLFAGATYLGGSLTDIVHNLDAGPRGVAAVGMTQSPDFPTAGGLSQGLSGPRDGFVTLLSAGMNASTYGTFLGGSGDENSASTVPTDCAWGPNDLLYVTGDTTSPDFPVSPGAFQSNLRGGLDAYVTVLDPLVFGPTTLIWSTYLGGSNGDAGQGIDVDNRGRCCVTGWYRSSDHPQVFAFNNSSVNFRGAMIAAFDASGRLRFSTSYGVNSNGSGIAWGLDGIAYVTGSASSVPTTPGAFQTTRASGSVDVWAGAFLLPFADWSSYGQGFPGTNGVPGLTASDVPILGTSIDLILGNSSGVATLAALAVGFQPASVPSPFGGNILVGGFGTPATLFVPAGGLRLPLGIPTGVAFCGVSFFLQAALVDPGASRGLSLTPGLRLDLGI